MANCIDQVFRLAPLNTDPRWEGHAATYGGTWIGTIERLIGDGMITLPGPYCIVRLDRTVNPDRLPKLAWVGTVFEDMTVIGGLHNGSTPTKIHRWPPK